MNKYFLLLKEYWEYSIIIISFFLLWLFSTIDGLKIAPSLILFTSGLSFVACLLITTIKHKNETKTQIFVRYLGIGFILPACLAIYVLISTIYVGNRNDSLFWGLYASHFLAIISILANIAIGYSIRFIITVKPLSTFFSQKLRITTVLLLGVSTIFVIFVLSGGLEPPDKKERLENLSFSTDGKNILFDRYDIDNPVQLYVYNLETEKLGVYQNPPWEKWTQARYSYDGKHIAFVITTLNQILIEASQIAIMEPDGNNIKRITNSPVYKGRPSFSRSGKKIIYRGWGKGLKDDAFYEVDIETGQEKCLSKVSFDYISSPPYFLPDEERYIFAARKKMGDNNIYVMQKGQNDFSVPYIALKGGVTDPLVTADGRIFFKTMTYKQDGSWDWPQYFEYSPEGRHKQLTNISAKSIYYSYPTVSPDGELLGFDYPGYPISGKMGIFIYRIKDGSIRKIALPDKPAYIINKK